MVSSPPPPPHRTNHLTIFSWMIMNVVLADRAHHKKMIYYELSEIYESWIIISQTTFSSSDEIHTTALHTLACLWYAAHPWSPVLPAHPGGQPFHPSCGDWIVLCSRVPRKLNWYLNYQEALQSPTIIVGNADRK